MTLRDAIASASSNHIARRDAETLLLHLLHRDRAWMLAHPEYPLDPATLEALRALTLRRAAHEPLQHLTGQQEFFGLELRVTSDTLIPRPETELLVEAVLVWAKTQSTPLHILDIGTGTGAIALALAHNLPDASVTATDLSAAALAVAQDNAARLDLADRIAFVQSDLIAGLDASLRFDVIASNPPYIPLADAPTLAPEVVDHEPHLALFGADNTDPDGLTLYRRLIPQAHAALRPTGLLALEFGFGQRTALAALFPPNLWSTPTFLDDYAAIPRIVLSRRLAP